MTQNDFIDDEEEGDEQEAISFDDALNALQEQRRIEADAAEANALADERRYESAADDATAGHHAAPSSAPAPPADPRKEFQAFFERLEIEHFKFDEFLIMGRSNANPGSSCFGLNAMPDRALWDDAAPLFRALDAIRKRLGRSVVITNCFRAPAYNTCIGGSPGSQHRLFKAADFTCRSGDPLEWAAAARAVRDTGLFKGGIGTYTVQNFVHIDVRGRNVDFRRPRLTS